MRYNVILFDLFGTVVHFRPQAPVLSVAGTAWRSTMHWLRDELAAELPSVGPDDLLGSLMAVTEEIVRARPPEYREVLSQERFRRALARVGVSGPGVEDTARRLSLRHMSHLAASTSIPDEHTALLCELGQTHRLGLISNFDHGPTARRVLAEHGIADHFAVTLISADFGRRKPHPAIFRAALRVLDVSPAVALYVGDTLADDVAGAQAAGMDVAWIDTTGYEPPAGGPRPTYTIRSLTELRTILG